MLIYVYIYISNIVDIIVING